MHNRKTVTKVLYHVFVILFGFMMVYPVLWMISGSFKGNAEILRGTLSLIPKELKLTNYATGWKGFGGTTFATFFTNSIFITVIATFGTVISSSLVAYTQALNGRSWEIVNSGHEAEAFVDGRKVFTAGPGLRITTDLDGNILGTARYLPDADPAQVTPQ